MFKHSQAIFKFHFSSPRECRREGFDVYSVREKGEWETVGKSDSGNWDKMVQLGCLKFINGLRLHPIDTINRRKGFETVSALRELCKFSE